MQENLSYSAKTRLLEPCESDKNDKNKTKQKQKQKNNCWS